MSSVGDRKGPYQTSTPVAYIEHESEEMVHVRRAELRYWASEVTEIAKNPLEHAEVWASSLTAIAVTAGLSALGVYATETETNKPPAIVYIVMLAVAVGCSCAAGFSWWINHQQRKDHVSRATTLSNQITAADTRSPRDPHVAAQVNLGAWLDGNSADIRKLKEQLETQVAAPAFDFEKVELIERAFWHVNEEILMKLQLVAPEWIDYYKQNPDWWNGGLTRIRPEQFADVVRVMDYTLDQIAHVRGKVTS